jgi:hypothetical protein
MALTHNSAQGTHLAGLLGTSFNNGSVEFRSSDNTVLATRSLGATAFVNNVWTNDRTLTAGANANGVRVCTKAVFINGTRQTTVDVFEEGNGPQGDNDLIAFDDVVWVSGASITVATFSFSQKLS